MARGTNWPVEPTPMPTTPVPFDAGKWERPHEIGQRQTGADGRQYQRTAEGWVAVEEPRREDVSRPQLPEGYRPPPVRAPRSGDLRDGGAFVYLDADDAAARELGEAGWFRRRRVTSDLVALAPAGWEPDPLLHEVR